MLSQADVDRQARLKSALDSLSVGRAVLVSKNGNDYTIAKLLNKSQQPDKVKLDFMAVQGTKAQIDSLVSLLNGGAAFDSIAASPLVAQSQKEMEVSLLDANSAMIKELIADRATGVYFAPDTLAEGGRIVRVAELNAPTTVYEIANVTFTTEPSNATINELEASLQDYVAGHRSAKEFTDSAQAGGYTAFPFYVSASTPLSATSPTAMRQWHGPWRPTRVMYRPYSATSRPATSSPWQSTTSMRTSPRPATRSSTTS